MSVGLQYVLNFAFGSFLFVSACPGATQLVQDAIAFITCKKNIEMNALDNRSGPGISCFELPICRKFINQINYCNSAGYLFE